MLIKQETLRRVANGDVRLAFRRWRRPTVRSGGTLLTSIGLLAIESVESIEVADITAAEAKAAGFRDVEELRAELDSRKEGDVYRVSFHLAGPDPRVALRSRLPEQDELANMQTRLERWDAASSTGSWTRATLDLISQKPGVRAADLAPMIQLDRDRFKANVRKLKTLGLTESLEVGYRLSPRGEAVLKSVGPREGPG